MLNRLSGGTARTALAALGLVMLTSTASPVSAQEIMSSVSGKKMESILSGMNIEFEKRSDTSWRLDLDGKKVLLIMANDNTDAQLYIGFGDVKVSTKQMNEWNTEKRFGRAYADADENPVLESDLDFAGGVTDEIIQTWIKLFSSQVKAYIKFLND
jgi:hemolysin activation/secretion protein